MKFSALLYIVLFLVLIAITWVHYSQTGQILSPYIVVPVALGGAVYMLGPQVDWWWYNKMPPKLDQGIVNLFTNLSEYYRSLDDQKKKVFNERVVLFIEAKEWIMKTLQGTEDMPYDVKAFIAFEPVRLTLNDQKFLMGKFDRYIVYPNPFLSMQFQDRYHASEIFEEDGVAIFSLANIFPAFKNPMQYFNVVLYEFAKIYRITNPEIVYPMINDDFWNQLPTIANYGLIHIQSAVGLLDIDKWGVAVHHYFIYPDHFRFVYPQLAVEMDNIFTTYHITS